MASKSYHPTAIVDNPSSPDAPVFPDVARLGKSRIGKKLLRKAIDEYSVALRRYEGRPAKTGPPIPASHKHGRREWFTLKQAEYGRQKSAAVRGAKAIPRHDKCKRLRFSRRTLREISEIVGYSIGHVSKICSGRVPRPKGQQTPLPGGYANANSPVAWSHRSRSVALKMLYGAHMRRRLASDIPDRRRRSRLQGLARLNECQLLGNRRRKRRGKPGGGGGFGWCSWAAGSGTGWVGGVHGVGGRVPAPTGVGRPPDR